MLDMDLTGGDFDPKEARKALANGGMVPPGRYHARLVKSDDRNAGATTISELTFVVEEGPNKGCEFRAKMWNSDKPANHNRHKLAMSALGMLVRGPGGKGWEFAEGLDTYADAVGAGCECVCEVEHVVWEAKNGKTGTQPEVTFGGFWNLSDPDVKAVKKAAPKPHKARAEVDADAI